LWDNMVIVSLRLYLKKF